MYTIFAAAHKGRSGCLCTPSCTCYLSKSQDSRFKIHEPYSQFELIQEEREIVSVGVLGHVGIRGNSAADSAAKDALDGDISDELIPFSDLKPCLNNYIFELWQRIWDEYPKYKLHKFYQN